MLLVKLMWSGLNRGRGRGWSRQASHALPTADRPRFAFTSSGSRQSSCERQGRHKSVNGGRILWSDGKNPHIFGEVGGLRPAPENCPRTFVNRLIQDFYKSTRLAPPATGAALPTGCCLLDRVSGDWGCVVCGGTKRCSRLFLTGARAASGGDGPRGADW
jgi:hypothetical protein